jgi:CheY-like chemotaxis protein
MKNGKGFRILSICDDDDIRFSRELVLKQEGYEVESMAGSKLLESCSVRSFHIAVLCHSLGVARAAAIADHLRRANPGILLLRVHAIRSCPDCFYDMECEVLPGPDALLQAISGLCSRLSIPDRVVHRKLA